MTVKSESEVTRSCLTLRDPMDCSLPGSSIYGIFQVRVLERGVIAFSCLALDESIEVKMVEKGTAAGECLSVGSRDEP